MQSIILIFFAFPIVSQRKRRGCRQTGSMASTFVDEGVYSRVIQSVPIVFFFFRPQSLKTPFLFYFALSKVIHCFWSIPPPYVDGNISKVSITCVHGCKVKKKAGDVMICFRLTVKKKTVWSRQDNSLFWQERWNENGSHVRRRGAITRANCRQDSHRRHVYRSTAYKTFPAGRWGVSNFHWALIHAPTDVRMGKKKNFFLQSFFFGSTTIDKAVE